MCRAATSRAFTIAALFAIFAVRSDSRGDAPKPPEEHQAAAAANPATEPAAKPARQHPIRQALAEPTEFDFVDTPLKDVVDNIAGRHSISLLLDVKTLNDAGVTGDTTITKTLKGIPLSSALHLMLAEKDLGYFVVGSDVLMITTAEEAKRHLIARTYDVRHFAEPVGELSIKFLPAADSSEGESAFRVGMFPIAMPCFGRSVFMESRGAWDGIRDLVISTVSPASWQSFGGGGLIGFANGNMIVTQTEEVHTQVAELLSELEAARGANPADLKSDGAMLIRNSYAAEKKIERSLDAPVDMDYTDTPLKDVIDSLQSQLGIPMQLDTKSLTDAGVTGDTPVTFAVKGIPAREAIRLCLAEKDLDFVIQDDVLLITTTDDSKTKTLTAVFPIGDLVGSPGAATGNGSYASLVDAIMGTIQPASWNNRGGVGSILPFPVCKALVVSQTEPILREIEGLLRTLRASTKSGAEPAASDNGPVVRIYSLPTATALSSTAGDNEKEGKQIVDSIQKLIAPKSWNDSTAFIGVVDRALIVRQTPEVQRQIQNLLEAVSAASFPDVRPSAKPEAALPKPVTLQLTKPGTEPKTATPSLLPGK